MISNIIKLIGVISASIIIGFIVGRRECSVAGGGSVTDSSNTTRSVTESVSVTETTEYPDGKKNTRITTKDRNTTDTDKKEKEVVRKERPSQYRISIAVRPEWHRETKTMRGHPVVGLGLRIMDSPAWAEIGIDMDRKDITLGVALEW